MMKFLLFVAPNNFRDETVALVKMFFDRWGIQYQLTSYSTKDMVGAHGAIYKPQVNTNKAILSEYDGIVLLDGQGIDDYKLYDYRPLLDVLMQMSNNGKVVCAINNAIKIVARANIIKDKKVAVTVQDPDVKRLVLLFHGVASPQPIEISKNVITITGTSLEGPMQEMLAHLGAI